MEFSILVLCLQVGIPFSFNDLWNRTLSLFEADFKHQGVYTCQARMTTGGPKLTKDATIIVTEKPHFKKYMAVSTLGEFGKAITVPCDVHAVPKPNLTWYRNGIPLSETPNLRYEMFKIVQTCLNLSKLVQNCQNLIKVFSGHMYLTTLGEFGKAITVPCDVHAVPKPNLIWYRNGIPLSETPNLRYELSKSVKNCKNCLNL